MSWKPREPKWAWRDYLTPAEAVTVELLDAQLESARLQRARAASIRAPIQNRAIHRAKYAAGKARP